MYEHVQHRKTLSIAKEIDTIIKESINVTRRLMEGLLLLFYEPCTAGLRDSEKTFNTDFTEVKVVVNVILNKVYSQGMNTKSPWEEVWGRFGKGTSLMNATDLYAGDRVSLFIDLSSMK